MQTQRQTQTHKERDRLKGRHKHTKREVEQAKAHEERERHKDRHKYTKKETDKKTDSRIQREGECNQWLNLQNFSTCNSHSIETI